MGEPDIEGERERVLFVAPSLHALGGIARYCRGLVEVLEEAGPLTVVNVELRGGRMDRIRASASVLVALARVRPRLLVLGHVGFGPIGWLWRALGRRYVVMAYGVEVWGPGDASLTRTLAWAREVWPISRFTSEQVTSTCPRARVAAPFGGRVPEAFFVEHEPKPGPFRALVVSRLDDLPYKGIDTCVEAAVIAARTCPIVLRIIGSGPQEAALDRLVDDLGATAIVSRRAEVSDEELVEEYATAGVVLLLSRFKRGIGPQGEGLGLAILEGGAAGTPGIASSIGGTADTVIDGETGWLMEAGDAHALAERLIELARQPDRAGAMGRAAREFVRATHSVTAFDSRVNVALARVVR